MPERLAPVCSRAAALTVKFHISRRYAYYLTKIVFPLVVIVVANHLIHFIEPHLLADRIANTFTMFIAACAPRAATRALYLRRRGPSHLLTWSRRLSLTRRHVPRRYALLYVVGEHVPRVDFLTTIDALRCQQTSP